MTPNLTYFRTLLSAYAEPAHRWRAAVAYLLIVLYGLSRLPLLLPDAAPRPALHIALIIVAGLSFDLIRRGNLRAGTGLFVGLLLVEGTLLLGTWDSPRGWIEIGLAVALAGLFGTEREAGIVTGLTLVILTAGAFHDFGDLSTSSQNERFAVYLQALAGTLALSSLTILMTRSHRLALANASKADRANHLIALSDELAHHLFARADLDSFLDHIANAIQARFPTIYHLQIYLIDTGSEQADLRAATGPVGERLLEQEYTQDIGSLSIVGRVTRKGLTVLIPDTTRDPIYKVMSALPETRSELAIPLIGTGNEVIGAIDIHSQRVNAFDELEVRLLEAMTKQIAIAVDSLLLYQTTQRSIRENQALYQQAQASLREIERLNYQLTGHAWADYLRSRPEATALTLDLETHRTTAEADWTPTLNEAMTHHQVITTTADGQRIVALPIMMGSEAIGAMEFELETGEALPEGALDLIRAVTQRLGMAMENRRLFDETQHVAQRETLINDIGTNLQSATGVDAIIQRAAHHLQEALGAQEVIVRLHMPEKETL